MSSRIKKHGEVIPLETRKLISLRYCSITKAINTEFWNLESEVSHSLYVGSYGRNTAINTSDIDILVELPNEFLNQYAKLKGNIQSRLLQTVRAAILKEYPRSDVHADGQIVKINFHDGMEFEILPAFKNADGSYRYPDSNDGGSWKSTNPKVEQDAMAQKNKNSNGLLYDTCKHIRFVHDNSFSSYKLSGIVIDSFVYDAIGNWRWCTDNEISAVSIEEYEQDLLNYYNQHVRYDKTINAPGSNDLVSTITSCECLGKVLRNMTLLTLDEKRRINREKLKGLI